LSLPKQNVFKFQVIAPTRELAQQTQKVVDAFGRSSNIRSVCLFGGVSRYPQINELQRGVDMVIATPGNTLKKLYFEVYKFFL
jgi:ATP-dependent RNA helicase DDX5/DBP2